MLKQAPSPEKYLSRSMMILVLWAGLFGMAVQFNESVKDLAIWVGLVEFFCLFLVSRKFDEREQQLLSRSYSSAFQWFSLVLLIAYGFLQVSEKWSLANNIASFINTHWIGMIVSVIGILLGFTGLRLFSKE